MRARHAKKLEILVAAANRAVEVQGVERVHVADIILMLERAGATVLLSGDEFATVLAAGGLDVRGAWVHAS